MSKGRYLIDVDATLAKVVVLNLRKYERYLPSAFGALLYRKEADANEQIILS